MDKYFLRKKQEFYANPYPHGSVLTLNLVIPMMGARQIFWGYSRILAIFSNVKLNYFNTPIPKFLLPQINWTGSKTEPYELGFSLFYTGC